MQTLFGFNNEEEFTFEINEQNELFNKYNSADEIEKVRPSDVPYELYTGYNNFEARVDSAPIECKSKPLTHLASKISERFEISSVNGEKEYQTKQRKKSSTIETTSTVELTNEYKNEGDSCYEGLFKLFEDKNTFSIGNHDDSLKTDCNSELQNLGNILSSDATDLNCFIGDLLKNCPSDIRVKKQRIYKAKNIKRKRKSKSQIRFLEKEFKINSCWDKEDIKRLSTLLGLKRDQVYKWYWDQKKKCDC